MIEQDFKKLVLELKPKLKRLSQRNRFLGFIDSDDLYQETLINLWSRLKRGEFTAKTKGYILKSCYFHIQNYIRMHKVRDGVLSLDEEISAQGDNQFCLKDIIADEKSQSQEQFDSRLLVDEIMNNGLTRREKEVFCFLYEGLNLREIGRRLGISHVRVLRLKQNICHKYKEKFFGLGVTEE